MLRRIETKWLIAIAFVLGLFMEILDMTVLNTALPAIGRDFAVGQSTLQYALTGYLVSLAIFIPASGWVADRFGSKWTFAFAIAVFTGASALAGASQSMEMLVAARVLQGVGGGMLTPVGTTMLFRAFPNEERAKASAVLAFPIMIAPAMGPVLGGWLTDNYSWRWIFYLNLPIGIIGLIFTLMFVPNQREDTTSRFDLAGFLLAGAGLSLLLVGLERTPSHGWSDPVTTALMVGGGVLLALFVAVELRITEPLLDLRLFRDRNFTAGNVMVLISTAAMMGILFLAPLMLQQVMGLTATESGLVTLSQVAGMMLVMPLGAKIYPILGARKMMAAGFAVLAAAIYAFSTLEMDSSLWAFRALLFVVGMAMALIMVPSQTATFETITHHDTARASSLFSTMRQFASAAGVAIISTVLSTRINANLSELDAGATVLDQAQAAFAGYGQTFLVSAVVAVVGIVLVMVFRKDSGKITTVSEHEGEGGMPGMESLATPAD
jgi:EmrB/QacA subfamily drug resistance transporter